MTTQEFIKDYWALIGTIFAAIIWAIRLEGRLSKAASDIRSLWKQREEDQRLAASSRSEVHDALTELQRDVKDILRALGERRQG